MKKIFDLFLAYGIAIGFVSILSNIILPIIYWINGYIIVTIFIIILVALTKSCYTFCRKNTRFPNKKNVMSFIFLPLYIAFILYWILKTILFLIGFFSSIDGFTYIYLNTGLDFMMALSFTVIMSIVSGICCFLYIKRKSTMLQILVSWILTILLMYGTFYIIQSENNTFIEKNEYQFNGLSLEQINNLYVF